MALSSSQGDERIQCISCGHTCKNAAGLKIHIGRMHRSGASSGITSHSQPDTSNQNNVEENFSVIDFIISLGKARQRFSIVRIIPKSARASVCEAFNECLEKVIQDNRIENWIRLLSFSFLVLRMPKQKRTRKKVSYASIIKDNLSHFKSGATLSDILASSSEEPDFIPSSNSAAVTAMKKLSEGDISGAVRTLCSEESMAINDEATLNVLRSKHPKMPESTSYPQEPAASTEADAIFSEKWVHEAINSFNLSSSGGVDCLRPRHLRDITSDQLGTSSSQLRKTLASFCDLVFKSRVPTEILPIFYGGLLFALRKKDGGLRPIACGLTLRRLVAKVVSRKFTVPILNHLGDHQLGFAVKGGSEAAVHALRSFTESEANSNKIVVKFDFKNAFNMLRRDYMLECVSQNFPEIFPFINQTYRHPSFLLFDNKSIVMSERGTQQGDPMGGALFCIAEKPLIDAMQSEFNVWFFDDGTIGGDPDVVLADIRTVLDYASISGLELNFEKCEVTFLGHYSQGLYDDLEELMPGLKLVDKGNLELLGSPIHQEGIKSALDKKRGTLKLMCDRLTSVDAHCALFMFRHCVGTPRVNYLLRSTPAYEHVQDLEDMNEIQREALEKILNIELTEREWNQSTLPLSMGGLGILKPTDIALPCFISSARSTRDKVVKLVPNSIENHDITVAGALETLLSSVEVPDDLDASALFCQNKMSELVMTSTLKGILNTQDKAERARLFSAIEKESSRWMHAVPNENLGTKLDNASVRIAVSLRLGAKIVEQHNCKCGSMVDIKGRHGLSCRVSAGRHIRHSQLNDVFSRALTSASIPNIREVTGLSGEDNKRPDGMTLIPFIRGRPLVWDATVSDLFASSNVDCAAQYGGAAADAAELSKINKYRSLSLTHIFSPLAFDTLGVPGADTRRTLKEVCKRLILATGEIKAGDYLMQRLSIEIVRGNAISVLGTFSENPLALKEMDFLF
jgi:hypothetical protein